MPAISLRNVSKRFTDRGRVVDAVKSLSMTATDGALTVLVGPSGSGKSTVLRLIAGLESADGGAIFFDEQEVSCTRPDRRNVAMVFQDQALLPHLSVADNIAFPLKMRGAEVAARDRRVQQIADRLGIIPLLDRMPGTLSGGEQQRVALARALVRQPAVVLLDEPASSLDAALRLCIRSEVRSIQKELGVTMIYVTHDQEEAMALADHMAIVRDGSLVQFGTPQDVYQRPDCRFVAEFLGSPPINLFEAVVDKEANRLQSEFGSWPVPNGATIDGASVVVGIRPQHLRMGGASSPPNIELQTTPLTVNSVEFLGSRSHVCLSGPNGGKLTIAQNEDAHVGDERACTFSAGNILLFRADAEGARLS